MTLSQYILLGLAVAAALVVLFNIKRIVAFAAAARAFLDEVRQEMKRVSWPSRDEVVNSTLLVGITTAIMVVIIGGSDSVLGWIVGSIFHFK